MATVADTFCIRFVPEQRTYTGTAPIDLGTAARLAGLLLEQPCAGRGSCGQCRVRIVSDHLAPTAAELAKLTDDELAQGWRLACQQVVTESLTVEVPTSSRAAGGKSFGPDILPEGGCLPVVQCDTVTVHPPSLGGQRADVDRLRTSLATVPGIRLTSPDGAAELREALGQGTTVSVVREGSAIISIRPATALPPLGLALDLGSTSLAAALIDPASGRVVAADARLNPQVAFGADVIARIQHTIAHADGLAALTGAVRQGVRELVGDLAARVSASIRDIVTAAVVGNPTMIHAWAGVSVAPLGLAPYVAAWSGELTCRARDVDLPAHPDAPVFVFPLVRCHVGGDAVAAAVACGLDEAVHPTLLIDLGTNTEVLLAGGGRLVVTSAAAGPAFEGATISCGMRAGPGAIDSVMRTRDGHLAWTTVGDKPPQGLCGSGLIDAVAALLDLGLISPAGRLALSDPPLPLPDDVRGRLVDADGQKVFMLVRAAESRGGREVTVSARDVRQVQLAVGSIAAATSTICGTLSIDPGELDQVLLAGAFGNYVRKASARRIGLVPPLEPDRIKFVGNAAGIGARLAVCDVRARDRARALAARAEYVELATDSRYQERFLHSLSFPRAGDSLW